MTDELRIAAMICAGFAALSWLLSLVTREYSWTDRLWSITPIVYVGWFMSQVEPREPRLVLMTVLVALWGARLTFNYARKGGYARGGEDYRWGVLRQRMSPLQFQLFNFAFIAGYQHLLLLLISLPAWVAATHAPAPLQGLDYVAAGAFLVLLTGETIADQQQWRFHRAKLARIAKGEPARPNFLTGGLFRFSRHPNFFCEQGMWWMFWIFGVSASGAWLNPGLVGPVLLTLLFLGSTSFTESITLSKYPEYSAYVRVTSRQWPWWPRRGDVAR